MDMRYTKPTKHGHGLLEYPVDFSQALQTVLSGFLGVENFEKDCYVYGF